MKFSIEVVSACMGIIYTSVELSEVELVFPFELEFRSLMWYQTCRHIIRSFVSSSVNTRFVECEMEEADRIPSVQCI